MIALKIQNNEKQQCMFFFAFFLDKLLNFFQKKFNKFSFLRFYSNRLAEQIFLIKNVLLGVWNKKKFLKILYTHTKSGGSTNQIFWFRDDGHLNKSSDNVSSRSVSCYINYIAANWICSQIAWTFVQLTVVIHQRFRSTQLSKLCVLLYDTMITPLVHMLFLKIKSNKFT